MLARWYAIFLGIVLLIMGGAGLLIPRLVTGIGMTGPITVTAILWLLTALLSLWFGFAVRSLSSLRWFDGSIGLLYLLWGVIRLYNDARGGAAIIYFTGVLATPSGMTFLLGALGLATALAPAYWLHERRHTAAHTAS